MNIERDCPPPTYDEAQHLESISANVLISRQDEGVVSPNVESENSTAKGNCSNSFFNLIQ